MRFENIKKHPLVSGLVGAGLISLGYLGTNKKSAVLIADRRVPHNMLTRSEQLFLNQHPKAKYIDSSNYDFKLDDELIEVKEVSGNRKLKAKLSQLETADWFFLAHYPTKIAKKPKETMMLMAEEFREIILTEGKQETSKARGDVWTIPWRGIKIGKKK